MIKMDQLICPWCQTEIVWDEEIGREEFCPHCFNELDDYRSVQVSLDQPTDNEGESENEQEDQLAAFEEAVQSVLDVQEEVIECVQCGEYMLHAGDLRIERNQFIPVPVAAEGLNQPFLQAPYTMKVLLCPSCFHVSHSLSDEDRLKLITVRKAY